MKNLILVFFFGLMLSLTSNYQLQAQNQTGEQTIVPETSEGTTIPAIVPENPVKQTFFKKIWGSVKNYGLEMGIAFVFGLFSKNGLSQAIKAFSGKAAVVLKETGETFIGGSNFFSVVNKAIRDDGTIDQNSIAQVIASGKEVIAEANDVIISIKPKKV